MTVDRTEEAESPSATETKAVGASAGRRPGQRRREEAGDPRAATAADPAEATREAEDLRFRVEASLSYHSMRRDFFERVDKWARTIAFFAASGAVASIVGGGDTLAMVIAVGLAAIQAAMLAWNPGEAARHHVEQYRAYSEIAERVARRGIGSAAPADIRGWEAQLTRIEADERPLRLYVWAGCWNDHATRIRSGDPLYRLTAGQRIFRHVVQGDAMRLRGQISNCFNGARPRAGK